MQSENTQPENIQSNSLPDNAYRELRPGIFRKGDFYEFSLSCQRLFGQNYPISGGGYVRLSNWSFVLPLLRSYLREQDFYVFYLHPFELSRQRKPAETGEGRIGTDRQGAGGPEAL